LFINAFVISVIIFLSWIFGISLEIPSQTLLKIKSISVFNISIRFISKLLESPPYKPVISSDERNFKRSFLALINKLLIFLNDLFLIGSEIRDFIEFIIVVFRLESDRVCSAILILIQLPIDSGVTSFSLIIPSSFISL